MKAKWKNAPAWAQWWVRDLDGFEWWHENEPAWKYEMEFWYSGGPSRQLALAYRPPPGVNVPRAKGCRPI